MENQDNGKELFTQDGVLLKSAVGRSLTDLNTSGTLSINEYPNNTKGIEWKPNDLITIDSEIQDQEWSVVNTIGQQTSTLGGSNSSQPEQPTRSRIIKLPFEDLKTFRVTRKSQQIQFSDTNNPTHSTFFFQHGNADVFIDQLKAHLKTVKSRHDRNTYVVIEPNVEDHVLNKSFAELDIFSENTTDVVWNLVSNFKQRPYATTMEAFSKLTDIVYYGADAGSGKREVDDEVADLLTRSMAATEDATTVEPKDGYELVAMRPVLPPRPNVPRGPPLSVEQWAGFRDAEGRVVASNTVKKIIFHGGISPHIRTEVWKYLLEYYPWNMSDEERIAHQKKKKESYFTMKLQWRSMTEEQEARFSDYHDRKSLVEKDVNRTDRTSSFYSGDNNPNLAILSDILMTYVMYNFDLGYVQGMSDLLSPILYLMGDEVDAFWCFVGFMDKIASNFDMDQAGMKSQLLQLQALLAFTNADLADHLARHDSANMYFCFRWLLVWFKREFAKFDILKLWEVLYTGLPCANFHLLICIAILDTEKHILIGKSYGFTEILKHINDLSMRIDLEYILTKAEGIYYQIYWSDSLTDQIRIILGMEPVNLSTETCDSETHNSSSNAVENGCNQGSGEPAADESSKNKSIMMNSEADEVIFQIGLDMNY